MIYFERNYLLHPWSGNEACNHLKKEPMYAQVLVIEIAHKNRPIPRVSNSHIPFNSQNGDSISLDSE